MDFPDLSLIKLKEMLEFSEAVSSAMDIFISELLPIPTHIGGSDLPWGSRLKS